MSHLPHPAYRAHLRRGHRALGPGATTQGVAAITAPTIASSPGFELLLGDQRSRGPGVATFATPPTAEQVDALVDLGLVVQPMRELPLALVAGTDAAMRHAVAAGVARDVYPTSSSRPTTPRRRT